MTTELKTTEQDSHSREVSLTSFFGGSDMGRSVQLTQLADGRGMQLRGDVNIVTLTQSQAIDTLITLMNWIDESPIAEGVLAERLIERSFSERESTPPSLQELYPNLIIEDDS